MIPAKYDIEIYRGDSYYGPLITLPDLSPFGGPSHLLDADVSAQVRTKGSSGILLAEFAVEIVDPSERKVRLTLTPNQTEGIGAKNGFWDLEVATADDEWVGTPLAGAVTFSGEVTQDE